MYNERADFEHHLSEVDEAFALLAELNLSPPGGSLLLDIGGGHGMHCGFMQRNDAMVICSDITDYTSLYNGSFIEKIHQKYLRNGFTLDLKRCAFVQADAMRMIFRDQLFDACMSFNAFEHIPDPELAFSEAIRVLKPGGVAYITLDPIWTCDTGSHFFGRVPKPWQHLVTSAEDFRSAMAAAGASPDELSEFPDAMNRKRLKDYATAIEKARARQAFEIVSFDTYAGYSDATFPKHPNHEKALALGYSEEELKLRRLRWVLRKPS